MLSKSNIADRKTDIQWKEPLDARLLGNTCRRLSVCQMFQLRSENARSDGCHSISIRIVYDAIALATTVLASDSFASRCKVACTRSRKACQLSPSGANTRAGSVIRSNPP